MLTRSLRLDGYHSVAPGSEPFEMRPINVHIGPNGAGKSNVTEAIELLAGNVGGQCAFPCHGAIAGRDPTEHGVTKRVVNTFLQLLDGFEGSLTMDQNLTCVPVPCGRTHGKVHDAQQQPQNRAAQPTERTYSEFD